MQCLKGRRGTGVPVSIFIGGRDKTRNHCFYFLHLGFGHKGVKDSLQADALLLIVTQI